MALTRAELIQKVAAVNSAMPQEECDIPELGGSVIVRGMSGRERDHILALSRIRKGPRKGENDQAMFRPLTLMTCLMEKDGTPLLHEEDLDLITGLPAGIIDRIHGVINRLSGWGVEEEEELEKNSVTPKVGVGSSSTSSTSSGASPSPNSSSGLALVS